MDKIYIKEKYLAAISHAKVFVDLFPWENREKYIGWLAQSYFFVKHSTRLLALSAANCSFEKNKMHKRMSKHIFEEIGHEALAANDLTNLGVRVSDLEELPITKAFYRLQYYGVEKMGASYLMGYILFLEGVASVLGPTMLARASLAHGAAATSFLKLHVEEDIGHVESAFENLDVSSEIELQAILESIDVSSSIYSILLKTLADKMHAQERKPELGLTL